MNVHEIAIHVNYFKCHLISNCSKKKIFTVYTRMKVNRSIIQGLVFSLRMEVFMIPHTTTPDAPFGWFEWCSDLFRFEQEFFILRQSLPYKSDPFPGKAFQLPKKRLLCKDIRYFQQWCKCNMFWVLLFQQH